MATFLFLFLFCVTCSLLLPGIKCQDPDTRREVPDLIVSRGFICETHYIVTEDGYILTAHRIVNNVQNRVSEDVQSDQGVQSGKSSFKRPIIVQHGLLSSGRDFIINSPGGNIDEPLLDIDTVGNNLGFELAKRNYDVWLTNSRGNFWALNHTDSKFLKSSQFWDFSFDEMIAFDLPATLNYILQVTNSTTLGYVGHSQGTLIMFGLLSTRPEFNDIVKPFIALSPITSVGYMTSPLVRFLAKAPAVLSVFKQYTGPLLIPSWLQRLLSKTMCHSPLKIVCSNILFIACGFPESKQLNVSRIGVYAHSTPAGTSAKNIVHFGQSVNSRKFAYFDYGKKNLDKYNSYTPPEYQLEDITNRDVYLVTADTDWFSNPSEINKLKRRMRSVKPKEYRIKQFWTHCDYLFGTSAGNLVNKYVIQTLDKYSQPKKRSMYQKSSEFEEIINDDWE